MGGGGGGLNGRQIPLETSPQSRTNCGDARRRRGTRDFSMIGHLCGDSVRKTCRTEYWLHSGVDKERQRNPHGALLVGRRQICLHRNARVHSLNPEVLCGRLPQQERSWREPHLYCL